VNILGGFDMAIYAVGAYFGDHDVSKDFIRRKIIGIGWSVTDAPDMHEYLKSLKVGDIVYIKSAPPRGDFTVKSIGLISSSKILIDIELPNDSVAIAREVKWVSTKDFVVKRGVEKNNVKLNSFFEEFNPHIQKCILKEFLINKYKKDNDIFV
jgi:hypothetical protein